jgi:hypothetical protein
MSNVINFSDAQTKRMKEEKIHFDASMHFLEEIQIIPPQDHVKFIQAFLERFQQDENFLPRTLKLLSKESQMKSPTAQALKAVTYEDRETILNTMETIWPKDIDTINRLRHVLKLYHFCSKQAPKLPFLNIIPRSVLMKFLLAPQRD